MNILKCLFAIFLITTAQAEISQGVDTLTEASIDFSNPQDSLPINWDLAIGLNDGVGFFFESVNGVLKTDASSFEDVSEAPLEGYSVSLYFDPEDTISTYCLITREGYYIKFKYKNDLTVEKNVLIWLLQDDGSRNLSQTGHAQGYVQTSWSDIKSLFNH